jgi:uncharacterized RDD family membrane protein YckC
VTGVGRVSGSWLDGPLDGSRADAAAGSYPGSRLGLPATGTGSVAGFGRRLGALFVDWIICLLIAGVLARHPAFDPDHPINPGWPTAVFALEYLVLLSLVGSTIGMRLFGIAVLRLDGRRIPLRWVAVRTVLLLLVIPAVVYDRDQRGLHDKAADAVAVRR